MIMLSIAPPMLPVTLPMISKTLCFQVKACNRWFMITSYRVIDPGKIHINMYNVIFSAVIQVVRHKDMIKYLGVTIKDKGVDIIILQFIYQVTKDTLLTNSRQNFIKVIGPLEGIQVAQYDDSGIFILFK